MYRNTLKRTDALRHVREPGEADAGDMIENATKFFMKGHHMDYWW
jgi:hypothetical protein